MCQCVLQTSVQGQDNSLLLWKRCHGGGRSLPDIILSLHQVELELASGEFGKDRSRTTSGERYRVRMNWALLEDHIGKTRQTRL